VLTNFEKLSSDSEVETEISLGSVKLEKDALNLLNDFIADVIYKIKQDSVYIAKSKDLDVVSSEEVNQAISNYFITNTIVPNHNFFIISDRKKYIFSVVDERGAMFEEYAFKDNKDWVRMGVLNDVEGFYILMPNPNYICSKGVGFLNNPISKVIEYIYDYTTLGDWDYFCEGGDILEIVDDFTTITHLKYKSDVFIFQSRDFLIVRHGYKKDDSFIILACSIQDSQYPPLSQYVRGDILFGGFLLQPYVKDGQEGTMMTYLSCADVIKPTLPTFLLAGTVTRIREKQPQTVHYIRKNLI